MMRQLYRYLLAIWLLFGQLSGVTAMPSTTANALPQQTFQSSLYLPGFITPTMDPSLVIDKKNREKLYSLNPILETFHSSTTDSDNQYPNVDTSGFLELKYSGRDYNDDISKLDLIRKDPYYQKLPMDVIKGDPRMDIRYQIGINGQLEEDLSIRYDVEKEPDFPGKYDINIQKDVHSLTFGDFDVHYQNGELITVKKHLNGIHLQTQPPNWFSQLSLGKTKSEPQKFEGFGTGEKKYKLGKTFILDGSEVVYVNNQKLIKDIDYTINYFEGTILFNNPLTQIDMIKVIYEFTNPIQDFIPSLSRKSFTGFQYAWHPDSLQTSIHKKSISFNETIGQEIKSDDIYYTSNAATLQLSKKPIVRGSESLKYKDKDLERNQDYFINYNTGKVSLKYIQLGDEKISANYHYFSTQKHKETIITIDSPGPYYLSHPYILDNEIVYIDEMVAKPGIDYTLDHENGKILFKYQLYSYQSVVIEYTAIENELTSEISLSSPLNVSVSRLSEVAAIREDLVTTITNEPPSISGNTLKTIHAPIDSRSEVSVFVNGEKLADTDIVSTDYYKGEITVAPALTGNTVQVSYNYLKSFASEFSFTGQGINQYLYPTHFTPPNFPIRYNGVTRITLFLNDGSEIELTPDQEFKILYGADGNQLEIELLVNAINPYLNSSSRLPNSGDTIRVKYLYTPDATTVQDTSTHSMTGINLNYQFLENMTIETEYVNSDYNFSQQKTHFSEQITTIQGTTVYSLSQNPIVEDSEQVFINGISLSRGRDYFINYSNGEFRLDGAYPSNTRFQISYDYFSGSTPNKKESHAMRINNHYKPYNNLDINNSLTYLDPYFLSLGELKHEKGTLAVKTDLDWEISSTNTLSSTYSNDRQKDTLNTLIKQHEQFTTKTTIDLWNTSTQQNYRQETFLDTQSTTLHDYRLTAFDNTILLGDKELNYELIADLSKRYENERSATLNGALTKIDGYGIKTNYEPTTPWILKKLQFSPYTLTSFQRTSPLTPGTLSDQEKEEITVTKYSRFYGFDSQATIIDGLTNQTQFEKKEIEHIYTSSYYKDPYYNYNTSNQYRPFQWIQLAYNLHHSESTSPIPGQTDSISDRKVFSVSEFKPYPALEMAALPTWSYSLFEKSSTYYTNQLQSNEEYNGLKLSSQTSHTAGIKNFNPFSMLTVTHFEKTYRRSQTENNQQTTGQNYYKSSTRYEKDIGTLEIKPDAIETSWNYGFDYLNSQSLSSQDTILSSLQQTTSDTTLNEYQSKHRLSYPFQDLSFGIIRFSKNRLQSTFADNQKIDISKTSNLTTNQTDTFLDNYTELKDSYLFENTLNTSLSNALSIDQSDAYYNRNKNTSTSGSLYKKEFDFNSNHQAQLSNQLSLTPFGSFYRLTQFTSPTLNITKMDLPIQFDKYLFLKETTLGSKAKYQPFNFISFISQVENSKITQETITSNNTKEELFNKLSGTLGTRLIPFLDLTIGYDFTVKKLTSNQQAYTGYMDELSLTYQPIKYDNFSVDIQFKNTKNWGFGFNEIDRNSILQSSGEILDLSVIQRDDATLIGSIIINIDLPLTDFKYLEHLKITGEGFIKHIRDTNKSENSLFISGFLFKNTITL